MLPDRSKYASLLGKDYVIKEHERPSRVLKTFDVLVKVVACGLSSTDYDTNMYYGRRDMEECRPLGTCISGTVQKTGSEVKTLKAGDNVAGIIPLSYRQSGCAEYVILEEYDLICVPDSVSLLDVSACLNDCVRAYIALFYCSKVMKDEKVLLLNTLPCSGIVIQVAHAFGVKVIAVCMSSDEKRHLEPFTNCLDGLIDLSNNEDIAHSLHSKCMKKTEDLGVDVILDLQSQAEADSKYQFSSETIISCLTIHGRWVSCNAKLQLDPPDSVSLFERCASVSFLNEQVWLISKIAQGKYQHILSDVINKLKNNVIRPPNYQTIDFISVTNHFSKMSQSTMDQFVVKMM